MELISAHQAAQYTGLDLTELAREIGKVGGKPCHIGGETYYGWDDYSKLRHRRSPEEPPARERKVRRKPADKKPATPEPSPTPEPEPDTAPAETADKPRTQRKRTPRAQAAKTAAQGEPAAPTTALTEHVGSQVLSRDEIPPYILDPDRLASELAQHGKGELIKLAKAVGLTEPFGFRRAQIARDIVVRQAEQWRVAHPATEVPEGVPDELAQRRKAKQKGKGSNGPDALRGLMTLTDEAPATRKPRARAANVPTFSDGRE